MARVRYSFCFGCLILPHPHIIHIPPEKKIWFILWIAPDRQLHIWYFNNCQCPPLWTFDAGPAILMLARQSTPWDLPLKFSDHWSTNPPLICSIMGFALDVFKCGYYVGPKTDSESYKLLSKKRKHVWMIRDRLGLMVVTYFDRNHLWNYEFSFRHPENDEVSRVLRIWDTPDLL